VVRSRCRANAEMTDASPRKSLIGCEKRIFQIDGGELVKLIVWRLLKCNFSGRDDHDL